jgi:AbrB family looped-hinge helix DNA binding protein
MRTTIDKAGRIVIPAALRERAGFAPGAELEITEDEIGIRIERVATPPRLVRIGRRLVARPTAALAAGVDVARLIDDERNRWP